jgi:cytochrome c oxidase subunit 3
MADIVHGESHGHAADHPPFLAHHFDTPVQQFDAGKLGMWLFLATEILLFGGLFCFYAVYRAIHPEIFEVGHVYLNKYWGAVNTVVLILSSFTMAYAVYCAQTGRTKRMLWGLCLTFLGGVGFMCVKAVEYNHKFHEGLFWGRSFSPHEELKDAGLPAAAAGSGAAQSDAPAAATAVAAAPADATTGEVPPTKLPIEPSTVKWAPAGTPGLNVTVLDGDAHAGHEHADNVHIFFSIYFAMTGLHGIHVLAGMAVIGWLIVRGFRGDFSAAYFTPVDLGGLYWHLVDLIWIFLFPLLYLIH